MKTIFIFIFLCNSLMFFSQKTDMVSVDSISIPTRQSYSIERNIIKKVNFKNGNEGLFFFMNKNIKYPIKAAENDIQGTVKIRFVVDKQGNISDIKIVSKKLGYGLEEEAIRVIELTSGMWEPREIEGQKVNSYYTQSIKFKIN